MFQFSGEDDGEEGRHGQEDAGGLSQPLVGTPTPYLTTHNFHWNVTGPMFDTLHTMFMAQYTKLGPRWTPSPSASAVWAIAHPADTRSSPA